MTGKRFTITNEDNLSRITDEGANLTPVYVCDLLNEFWEDLLFWKKVASQRADELNALHEENVELKNSLKEFEVFESNRIKGGVVTNDDFSVTLHSNNEAYMVCNMLNRFIRGVKNGNED